MWIKNILLQLSLTIGSLGIAVGSLISLHEHSDRVSNAFGAFLTSMGFVHFISFTSFLHKVFLETSSGLRFMKKYKLGLPDVLDITNKVVSVVQASFSCIAGIIVCRWSCTKNFLTASHYLSESYAWFGAAYFFYDIWSMYRVSAAQTAAKLKEKLRLATNGDNNGRVLSEKSFYDIHNGKSVGNGSTPTAELYEFLENEFPTCKNGSLSIFVSGRAGVPSFLKYILDHPIMVLHHIFIGSYGLLVLTSRRDGMGDCIFTTTFLMEFSTPFVNIRGILSIMGMKKAKVYVINGVVMLLSFFACRIFLLPYVLYLYSQAANLSYLEAAIKLPTSCKWSIAMILLPQIYWFNLMLKGASKVFFPPKQKTTSTSNNNNFQKLQTEKLATKVD